MVPSCPVADDQSKHARDLLVRGSLIAMMRYLPAMMSWLSFEDPAW